MQARFDRAALLNVVRHAITAVDPRSPRPALTCLHIEAYKDKTATVTGTNLRCLILWAVNAKSVKKTGCVLVPAIRFQSILRAITTDAVGLSLKDDKVVVTAGKSRFTMPTTPVGDFAEIPVLPDTAFFEVPTLALQRLVSRASVATDAVNRFRQDCIQMQLADGRLMMIATDSRRIVIATEDIDGVSASEDTHLIHVSTAVALSKLASDAESVFIAFADRRMWCKVGEGLLVNMLEEGTFPDVTKMIPEKKPAIACNVAELLAALTQAETMTSLDSRTVACELASDSLTLRAQSAKAGTAAVVIPAEWPDEPASAGVNPAYLKDMIRGIADERDRVSIECRDNKHALVVRDDGYIHVLAPSVPKEFPTA
jgi:DNA polymerase-3 subunit beta